MLLAALLAALFPGMRIEAIPGKAIDTGWRPKGGRHLVFDDPLRNETVYRVEGRFVDETERCASENMLTGSFSTERHARLRVFPWPRRAGAYVGVIHYRFEGASPAGSCTSITRVFTASRRGSAWSIDAGITLDTQHHRGLQAARMLDLTGDGVEEFLVESDTGGAGAVLSILSIFHLRDGKLAKWFSAPIQAETLEGEFHQELDAGATRSSRGRWICFTRTEWRHGEQRFDPPRVGQSCVPAPALNASGAAISRHTPANRAAD